MVLWFEQVVVEMKETDGEKRDATTRPRHF